jgi:uncharacterized membrane protein YedE/YeeE
MKQLKFLIIGILFGIIMSKAEIVSWFRIYEMFKFQSFHMYGVIGSAVLLAMISMYLFKKKLIKSYKGETILVEPKIKGWRHNLFGGIIFGLGWALAGACPGPMFVLLGMGIFSILVVILGAFLGTFIYGLIYNKLPR